MNHVCQKVNDIYLLLQTLISLTFIKPVTFKYFKECY
ncbi:hypothetical protein [Enterococcus phage vB_Efm8_KEN21]